MSNCSRLLNNLSSLWTLPALMLLSQLVAFRSSNGFVRKSVVTLAMGLSRPVRSMSTTAETPSTLASLLLNPRLLPSVDLSAPTFEVRDPAKPDTVVGVVPTMDRQATNACIERSHKALASWRDDTTAAERARLLNDWSRLIQDNKNDIATIMTMESGKPLKESLGEVTYGTSFLDFYAAEAVRPTGAGGGFLVPTPFAHADTGKPRGQIMAIQQAVGVTASITPWNFPLSMVRARKYAEPIGWTT
jgi:acyl-CoA reductase-like NAD-dependent aldehyde dehydrogenase